MSLRKEIQNHDFIILTGAPGVGKTKLALEGIKSFLEENLEYNAYCVSYKHHTLLDDLYQYMDSNNDYILFVDDANRIDAFSQITGFYKASRKGKLKVIITVRNYAFQEVGNLCFEFSPMQMEIKKFSDEEIVEIIKQDPFNILNSSYYEIIKRIADGNPRLAIMVAQLAIAEQRIEALSDVSGLFDSYFSTFIKDDGAFTNELNIKCLGLISFFYTIPYKDKEISNSILRNFSIDYRDFIEAINNLDKLEIVELQFEHVKIPEQNLSTYFFYKAFIKDNLLSFEILLVKYYNRNKNRFRDSVIPANNTFGALRVMAKIQPHLNNYWKLIANDQEKGFDFLDTFWFYLSNETFEFILKQVEGLPVNNSKDYLVTSETNDFSHNKERLLSLVENFFRYPDIKLKDALQLAFEYVRKKPEYLPELIQSIRDRLKFDRDDERFGFLRQIYLFDLLFDGLKNNDSLYTVSFYELAKYFLNFQYHHTKGGRNHSFIMYQFALPNNEVIQKFRSRIWKEVHGNFKRYPEESFSILLNYGGVSPGIVGEIMEYDVPFVLRIINTHLTKKSFDHCQYVQNQIRSFNGNSVDDPSFEMLLQSFRNSTYDTYLKLDWNWLRDKKSFEFVDFSEYDQLKEKEIRSSFIFESLERVESFLNEFTFLKNKVNNEWGYNNSLDLIIDENYNHNPKIGIALLSKIIENNNEINYIPRIFFLKQLKTNSTATEIWSLLQSEDFNSKALWELSFFDYLEDALINQKYADALINSVNSLQGANSIHFDRLQRYLLIEPDLFQKILQNIVHNNDQGNRISVWMDFFSVYFDKLGNDMNLIKKAYLQQERIQNRFDYEAKGFLNILKTDPQFLIEYVDSLYLKEQFKFSNSHKNLGIIWKIKDIESVLKDVFELILSKSLYLGILDHFCNIFYKNIPEGFSGKAKKFLLEYVKENHSEYKKMNAVVDIARNSIKEIYDEILLLFVSLNQDPEVFSKIWWRGNGGGVRSGDVIFGDIEAAEWRNILSVVERSDVGIKLIPIKKQINEKIQRALRSGDWERKRRFLDRD